MVILEDNGFILDMALVVVLGGYVQPHFLHILYDFPMDGTIYEDY